MCYCGSMVLFLGSAQLLYLAYETRGLSYRVDWSSFLSGISIMLNNFSSMLSTGPLVVDSELALTVGSVKACRVNLFELSRLDSLLTRHYFYMLELIQELVDITGG